MGKPVATAGDPTQVSEEFWRAASARFEANSTMYRLADDTGGRHFTNSNDIRRAVTLALRDSAAYYTLGYYPSNRKWDGRFRDINVRVARQGVRLRHRRGYYALDPDPGRKDEPEMAATLANLALPATSVRFFARIPPPEPAAETTVEVEFLVDARTISFEEAEAGAKFCDLDFQVVVLALDGAPIKTERDKVSGELRPETYRRLTQDGIPHKLRFKLPPGSYHLRLGVRDNRTGLFGSTEVSLLLPQPPSPGR